MKDGDTNTEEEKSMSFKKQPSDRTKKKTIVFTAEIDKYLALPLITRKKDPVVENSRFRIPKFKNIIS